jgi:2-polyprenyl-3-methyl-5-hydroxy-6-metoxy-1,4-benzoquinol methylase
MIVRSDSLDEFVAASDRHGGPGHPACDAYWRDFRYEPASWPDQSLDPYGLSYFEAQLRLYRELSGRGLDQSVNEHTAFDLSQHVEAVNPYAHPGPSAIAVHLQRLSRALRLAGIPRHGHVLDMGCGWGLSSELLAYLDLSVTAVDINPAFVELVNRRAARGGRRITAIQAGFDDFTPRETCDAILFYECLHHATRPWEVVGRLAGSLKPGGALILAGEPFNSHWWDHWGLRLDALSVYCIRKFGWFESGWSLSFMQDILSRAGLVPETSHDADPEIGIVMIGRRPDAPSPALPAGVAAHEGPHRWSPEDGRLVLHGQGWIDLDWPDDATECRIILTNHRPGPLRLRLRDGLTTLYQGVLPTGPADITLARQGRIGRIAFTADQWTPDEEIGNGDTRRISVHLDGVSFG